jgi:hypothetical protein
MKSAWSRYWRERERESCCEEKQLLNMWGTTVLDSKDHQIPLTQWYSVIHRPQKTWVPGHFIKNYYVNSTLIPPLAYLTSFLSPLLKLTPAHPLHSRIAPPYNNGTLWALTLKHTNCPWRHACSEYNYLFLPLPFFPSCPSCDQLSFLLHP